MKCLECDNDFIPARTDTYYDMTNIITKLASILTISIFFMGCAACKSGQVKIGSGCYWPGQTYTTSLTGGVIRD